MLKENTQMRLSLSPYSGIYDAVVAKDHLLRKIKENIDFSFVNPMLKKQYCEALGRPATEPEMMFKLCFLKKLYDLSDVRLVSQAQTDMAVKYFLELEPEAGMIDPSLMTKFRKLRITEDILEEMLRETVRQAIEKGIIKSSAILVDATHSAANAKQVMPTQVLRELSRQLRREIYKNLPDLSEEFPEKPEATAELDEEIDYTRRLLEATAKGVKSGNIQGIADLHRHIGELLESDEIRKIRSKNDEDARLGHKSRNELFFGYKNHIAMTEEGIISGVEVSTGSEADNGYLIALSEKSRNNGIDVKEIVGDMAYVSQRNLEYCKGIGAELIAQTNTAVAALADEKDDGFVFNKDAGTMQCPGGELAMRARKEERESGNTFYYFVFSKKKCRKCPLFEQCPATKKKWEFAYSLTVLSPENLDRLAFEQSETFLERLKTRYRIEEKNGEMKVAHGLRRADSTGLAAMRLQLYFTAFAVNVKRIARLASSFSPISAVDMLITLAFPPLRKFLYA
jgi:transposase